MEPHQAVFEDDAEVYFEDLSLFPSEQRILSLLRDRWASMEMLDIGIGCGRTTYTFSAVAGSYLGIDYSSRMIELARQRLGAWNTSSERVELAVADARNLSSLRRKFDFILFSYNGIDAMGHSDRIEALAELRRIVKPDGSLFLSTHSLRSLPLTSRRPETRGASLLRAGYMWLGYLRELGRVRRANKAFDVKASSERGWTMFRDGVHDFRINSYFVDPAYQVEQFLAVGFEVIAIYDAAGMQVDVSDVGRDPWLHYHCRPVVD